MISIFQDGLFTKQTGGISKKLNKKIRSKNSMQIFQMSFIIQS